LPTWLGKICGFLLKDGFMLKKLIPILRVFAVFLVIALAWNLRLDAATYLPVDYDEDETLCAAFQAVPCEVEEAAFLGGTNNLTSFIYITMPLALFISVSVAGIFVIFQNTIFERFAFGSAGD
jgi:ABC-type glycerol-3-phosphate transport system permease component